MPADHTTAPCPLDLGPLGCIEGLTVSNKSSTLCHYFGGLPYALPPVGPYRFRRARPLPDFFRYGTKANPGRFAGGTGVCPQPGYRGNPDKSLWDEDCLQLNIYIPTGDAPKEGWPVFFFIHGGWLQFGNPNTAPKAMAPLLSETQFRAVIVQPAYRLNAFGFLACKELQWEAEGDGDTVGNLGFWDQRMALEWVKSNINRFGGDAENITVGGLSAGAHSTFQQLAHDLYLPDSKSIIKRAIMFSNGSGVQPKSLSEHQTQFDELLNALRIPLHLSGPEKLAALRKLPSDELVDIQSKLKYSEFRALSDGAFVSGSLIHDINTGLSRSACGAVA
ncbi:hypothetical protein H2203_008139 [Taxawa tesnikishii (nom. ined.)]|nr:hypothetical protein H2203_008139 [Dothideales sp. JES 119]